VTIIYSTHHWNITYKKYFVQCLVHFHLVVAFYRLDICECILDCDDDDDDSDEDDDGDDDDSYDGDDDDSDDVDNITIHYLY